MSITIGDAVLYLQTNNAGFDRGLKDAKKTLATQLQYMAKSFATDIGISTKTLAAAGAAGIGVGLGLGVVAVGAKGVEMAYKGLILPAQQYVQAMGDLARRAQISTEEASRWNEVAEMSRVELSALQTGFRFLTAQGIQPTIENVGRLADKFNAIQDPVAKMQFAMKNFGSRGGAEIVKILELGSVGINNYATSMRDGLLVSSQMTQDTKDLFAAQDEMNDAWQEFTIVAGVELIPLFTDLINFAVRFADALRGVESHLPIISTLQFLAGMRDSRQAIEDADHAAMLYTKDQDLLPPALAGTSEALESMSSAAALAAAAEAYLGLRTDGTTQEFLDQYNQMKEIERQLEIVMGLMRIADGMTAEMRIELNTSYGPGFAPSPTELAAGGPSGGGDVERVYDKSEKRWYLHNKKTGAYTPAQHGLEGIVPFGFPNDSFLFGATSGEEVIVRTKEQQKEGGGGDVHFHAPITIANGMDLDAFIAMLKDAMRR